MTRSQNTYLLATATAAVSLLQLGAAFPGPAHLKPTIHFAPPVVSEQGGWHDVAGAITHNSIHHVYQGTGWNHAKSHDLVHWEAGVHGPAAINETYAGMFSHSDPCSGFVTKDPEDNNRVCAGFRQCGSKKGVAGSAENWDVPLELRCALDDSLTTWATQDTSPGIDYLFNVSFWRGIPYDPARPWREADGNWYQLLSMDGCNSSATAHLRCPPSSHQTCCEAGGQLVMWKSPKLRGKGADWQMVGPVFTSAGTVLGNGTHLAKEFVTIDFLGSVAGDPKAGQGLGTRFFLNNVGGNGGGDGCCSGTTSYFVLEQSAPGAPMEAVKGVGTDGQLMLDWGSFQLKPQAEAQAQAQPAGVGLEPEVAKHGPGHLTGLGLLDGSASRGLSMARTLGSEEADQVTQPGRRVLIGWAGPSPLAELHGQGSAQSLPRELSVAPDRSLYQRFVPELERLRQKHLPLQPADHAQANSLGAKAAGLQLEVLARFPSACGRAAGAERCVLSVLGGDGAAATTVTLAPELGLVLVNATSQGNGAVRAGPLPPPDAGGGWSVHAIVDHSILEVIISNATALLVYAAPSSTCPGDVMLRGAASSAAQGASLDVWALASANNM